MKIKVTEEHILNGRPGSPYECPIALAMASRGLDDIEVVDDTIWFIQDNVSRWRRTPSEAANFIKMFDAGIPVKPFEFEL